MHQLKRLTVNGLPITDAGLDHLASLQNLEVLRMHRTKVTKRCRAALKIDRLAALENRHF
jgi:hypothetical protein